MLHCSYVDAPGSTFHVFWSMARKESCWQGRVLVRSWRGQTRRGLIDVVQPAFHCERPEELAFIERMVPVDPRRVLRIGCAQLCVVLSQIESLQLQGLDRFQALLCSLQMGNIALPVIIEVEDLVVEYDIGNSQFTAVDIPAWSLEKGEQAAIFGPSGCGKSTLLHVLAGLLAPNRGRVNVCGQDLGQLSESDRDHFRAGHIGYIFQDFNLLQGYTAVENVLLGMTFSRQRPDRRHAQELLTRVGLSHREKHRPSEMSIGERQRVAIARALAAKPELILADEPTGSLDPFHACEVVKLLGEACREHGCSLVVVSHDQGVVGAFDSSVPFMELNRAFSMAPSAAITERAAPHETLADRIEEPSPAQPFDGLCGGEHRPGRVAADRRHLPAGAGA